MKSNSKRLKEMGFKEDFLKWYEDYLNTNAYGIVLIVDENGENQTFIDNYLPYYEGQYDKRCFYVKEEKESETELCSMDNLWHVLYDLKDENSILEAMHLSIKMDPEIILIDTIHNETMLKLAMLAAQTGHLVIAGTNHSTTRETLHWIFSNEIAIQNDFLLSDACIIEYRNKWNSLQKEVKITSFAQSVKKIITT